MADTNNNGNQEEQTNIRTDSNLPILFANGYPTSLEKMSSDQLELFIPFLIKCSKDGSDEDETTPPKWWPSGIEYKFPLEKPKNSKKNWESSLRNIVEVCYEFHNQPFLLKYSHQLSQNDTANLRYVTASDTTTSLYSRHPKKLLLTFRNENMLYDNKKKRMKLWTKDETESTSPSASPELNEQEDEDSSTFQIILCDNCDGEFYSDEAFTQHDKECGKAVDETPVVDNIVISDDEDDEIDESDNLITGQHDFMAYFFLASSTATELPRRNNSLIERSLSPKKKKRNQIRTRNVISKREKDLEKTIPFSSPAGLVLTKKCMVTEDYVEECFEDIDAYTTAKQTTKLPPRPRNRLQTGPDTAILKYMRKTRNYYWPKRNLNSNSEVNFEFLNRSMIDKLPSTTVVLRKLTDLDIRGYQDHLRKIRDDKKRQEAENCVDLCSDSDDESASPNDQMKLQGDFAMMSMTDTNYRLISPGVSLLPPFPAQQPIPEIYITKTSRTSTSRQIFPSDLKELSSFTSTTSSVTIASSSKRPSEGETPETHRVKIQKWIQNVNGENFNTTNQVSVVNIN